MLNQTIKRNINRFPKEFCFQLTIEEIDELSSRSQIVTLNKNTNKRGYNIKYLPYVLTEQGIMMLSGSLKSDIAKSYDVETKRINEAVKNNPEKFPKRFSWKISIDELENLKSKISTSSSYNGYGERRYSPRVFNVLQLMNFMIKNT